MTTKEQAEAKARRMTMLHDNVLIWLPPKEEVTEGGIVLPDESKEREREGVVIAVGPLAQEHMKTGDTVVFPPSGASFIYEKAKHIVTVKAEELLSVLHVDDGLLPRFMAEFVNAGEATATDGTFGI